MMLNNTSNSNIYLIDIATLTSVGAMIGTDQQRFQDPLLLSLRVGATLEPGQ